MSNSVRDTRLATIYPLLYLVQILITVCSLNACSHEEKLLYEKSTDKELSQILEDAEFAITERNFRINNRVHIGKAIRERGTIGFPDYEVILFCNLSHAKRMLELAPDYINYCPQRITIRDDGQNKLIVASMLPRQTESQALNKVTGEVNAFMIEIVEYAARKWPEVEE